MPPEEERPYRFDVVLSDMREADLTARLVRFNHAHKEVQSAEDALKRASAPLHVFALDADGIVVGGVTGRTHGIREWLEVSIVWVDETARKRGLGRQLMQRAEAEAVRRGCRYARLATSNFQAPGFYEKLGYTLYGRLDDCPPGETVFYFRKGLQETEPVAVPAEGKA